jgi:hypothetical protein
MARSPRAVLCVYLKFSTDTLFDKIQILEQAVRKFVIARPREWAKFVGFRATQVQADLGFIGTCNRSIRRGNWTVPYKSNCVFSFQSLQSMLLFFNM